MNNQPSILDQINANSAAYGAPDMSSNPVGPGPSGSGSVLDQLHGMEDTQPTAQTPQPEEKGNWFTHLLPTITGIGGGLLGTLADPFTAGLGTFAGGAAGSGLGKALENAIEGNSDVGQGVAGETALGLLGGGIGKVGEGALKGVGGLIKGSAEKGLVNAEKQAAEKAALSEAKANQLNYGGLSQKLQSDYKLGTNQEHVRSMGFDPTSPFDMNKVSQAVVPLNQKYAEALASTKPVDMRQFGNTVFDMLKKSGSTDLTASPMGKALSSFEEKGGKITDEMSPTDVRMLQQEIGTQIGNTERIVNNANLQGMTNVDAESSLDSLHKIYNDLGGRIKTPELNAAIKNQVVDDAERADLVAKHGETLGNHIADTINNASDASHYLNPMQQYTQMGRASNIAMDDILNATGTSRAAQRAKFAANGEPVTASGVSGNPTAGDIVGEVPHPKAKILGSVLNLGNKGGAAGEAKQNLGSTIQRLSSVLGLSGGEILANSPNSVSDAANGGTMVGGTTPADMGSGNIEADIMNSNSPNTVALKQLLMLEGHGGGYNVPSEMGMFANPAADELKNLTQANLAKQQLAHYISLLNAAGGAQGPVGGVLNQLGSTFTGGPASQLAAERAQIEQSLSKLTGGPVNLPSIMQNQQTANGVLDQLQSGISSYGL